MARKYRILPNYTYDDYVQWKGRWEIIDGIPFALSPAPTIRHQRLAARVRRELGNQLAAKSCKCEALDPIDVKINDYTVLQPDVVIVCNAKDEAFIDTPPELVVEVLSPSTRLKDLNDKFSKYETFGIKYYVIVDPENNSITVYCRNKDGEYVEQDSYDFDLPGGCKFTADLDAIWN